MQLQNTHVTVPNHVVFRPFVTETVVLNLKTGLYHGLNPVAGRMLELLQGQGSIEAAARALAEEVDVPLATVLDDLQAFCADLAARDLLVVHDAPSE
jgi:hypothetical protein